MIETLPLLTPNVRRSERTLARCHDRLSRQHKRRITVVAHPNTTYLAIERAVIGVLCVIYMSGVAAVAIKVLMGG